MGRGIRGPAEILVESTTPRVLLRVFRVPGKVSSREVYQAASAASALDQGSEAPARARMAQLAQGLDLDLADALACHGEA